MSRRLFEHRRPRSSTAPEPKTLAQAVEAAALNERARKLGELLGAAESVKPVEYTKERRGRWLVEHGRAGDDYVFQLHPLKALARPWQDVITGFIAAMDAVFPRTTPLHYRRPDEEWQLRFFTVRVDGVCRLPGWESAIPKAIDGLAAVDAWSHPAPAGKRGSDE